MKELDKDTQRLWTTNQCILRDIRTIQAKLELVLMHFSELENQLMMMIVDEENPLPK
jgi:hypothetical protein